MPTMHAEFADLLGRVDRSRLHTDLDKLRYALASVTLNWHLVETVATRLKLDGAVERHDKDLLLALMRHAAADGRQGCRLAGEVVRRTLHDTGLLDLLVKHVAALAPELSIRALPPIDVAELRQAGLSDGEILHLLRDGMRTFRMAVDDADPIRLARTRFARSARQVGSLGAWTYRDWRRDIVDGDSGWEVFWDAVKVVGGAVIVVANAMGALETAGAAVVSIASGAGLIADGMHDIDKDVDDAMGIRR